VDARRGNLPTAVPSLIGRERALSQAVDLMRTHRLVTLTGVGGVGKTRLALEVGAELSGELPDGVWLVELAAVGDAASVPDAIATAIGVAPQAGVAMMDTVAEALSGRRLLLVLDNCEHVVDAAASAVQSVLARSGAVKLLCTSRESLSVGGEQRMSVPPLALDGGVTSAAATLFAERAGAVNPQFDMTDSETADAVIEICVRLDGIALGIELAAARMGSMTPVDVRDRLDGRFRLLAGGRGPERQQTLRQAVRWSYELLNDDERNVLRHTAVFSGGFDVAAITDVVDGMDDIAMLVQLDALVRKSLVIADVSMARARYRVLETIRQFAEDELSASGALEQARDRHAAYFAREVIGRWERWNGPGFREAVDWVDVELANLRSAFRWSADRPDVETAVDLAAHATMIAVSVQLFETVTWAEEIVGPATAADVRRLPRALTAAGYACFTGRPEQAVGYAHAAVELETNQRYEPFEDGWPSLVEALAQVYAGHLDRYVEITSGLAAGPGPGRAFGAPAHVDGLQATGRVEEAVELAEEAVAAAREAGNPWIIAYALWCYGSAFAKADPAHALESWREALAYVQQHRIHFFEGFIARDAARPQLADADPDDALALFDAAINSFHQAGNVAQLTITLASATSLFERIGCSEAAGTLYGAIARQPGSDHHAPDLPDVATRLMSKLGATRFDEYASSGTVMDLSDAARYAREQILLARSQRTAGAVGAKDRPAGLSRREVEVLRLAAKGLTTREIAERLFISAKTADHHIQHVYTKIGVTTRPAAMLWAIEHDLA
jgi:predicted ATPase/DNA-binding CsgD family transcriptional regulator